MRQIWQRSYGTCGSKAKLLNEAHGKENFNDVAGVEEAKEEVGKLLNF